MFETLEKTYFCFYVGYVHFAHRYIKIVLVMWWRLIRRDPIQLYLYPSLRQQLITNLPKTFVNFKQTKRSAQRKY